MEKQQLTSFETAALAANWAEDKKAKDTLVLKTDHVSTLADYFVIASVESRTQMVALADYLLKSFKQEKIETVGYEIDKGGRWTLLDFGDVVIHLFHHEDRAFYKLERFWNHATEVPRAMWYQETRQAS